MNTAINSTRWMTLGLALACTCAAPLTAQRKKDKVPKWRIDPYTQNDPEEMAKFGYVSYGPFPYGQRGEKEVTTADIEKHLSYEQILWVETAHFRIGLMLDDWAIPTERKTKGKLRAEITALQEKTGNKKLKPKTRKLDRWLRLHLYAARLENLYAEVSDWLGVKDTDFPTDPDAVRIGQGEYMGMGPYLGQTGKYLVFVGEAKTSVNDYLKHFTGRDTPSGQRWNFKLPGSLIYAIATEMEDNRLKHDTALHANIVYNVTHNLIDGYRFYSYDAPVWIKVGIAHWFERRVSPKWNTFDLTEGSAGDRKNAWKWEPLTRKLITNGKVTPFSEAYTWRDYGQIGFEDHVAMWSRWDFLFSLGKEKFGKFMKHIKGRVDPKTYHANDSDLVGAARTGLQDAYGMSPLLLDERWAEWVKANYSSQ